MSLRVLNIAPASLTRTSIRGSAFGDFGGDPLHFRDARQIGIMDRMGKAGCFLAKPRQRSLAARSVSRHQNDPSAHLGELFGSNPSDAGGASRDLPSI